MQTASTALQSGVSPHLSETETLKNNLAIYKAQLAQFERMAGGFESGVFYYLDKKKVITRDYQIARTNIMFFKDLPKTFHKDFKRIFTDAIEHFKVLIFNTELAIQSNESR